MAFRWRAYGGPTLNGVLIAALRFFMGSGPVLLENAIFFVIFQLGGGGGWSGPPVPLLIHTWSCLYIKLKLGRDLHLGPSWHGPSFESWAELAWAELVGAELVLVRVVLHPYNVRSCHLIRLISGPLFLYVNHVTNHRRCSYPGSYALK